MKFLPSGEKRSGRLWKMAEKFVEFDEYCDICKYKDVKGYEDPCNECLDNPVNEDSHRPVNFKKDE